MKWSENRRFLAITMNPVFGVCLFTIYLFKIEVNSSVVTLATLYYNTPLSYISHCKSAGIPFYYVFRSVVQIGNVRTSC